MIGSPYDYSTEHLVQQANQVFAAVHQHSMGAKAGPSVGRFRNDRFKELISRSVELENQEKSPEFMAGCGACAYSKKKKKQKKRSQGDSDESESEGEGGMYAAAPGLDEGSSSVPESMAAPAPEAEEVAQEEAQEEDSAFTAEQLLEHKTNLSCQPPLSEHFLASFSAMACSGDLDDVKETDPELAQLLSEKLQLAGDSFGAQMKEGLTQQRLEITQAVASRLADQ